MRNISERPFIKFIAVLFSFSFISMSASLAADMETKAEFAYLEDMQSGSVLLDKDANQRMAPASMAKLVTAAVVFDEIKLGRLSLQDSFNVSETAWKRGGEASGGSTMFLRPGSSVSVENLLKGAIIQSGNDACITLAEGIAGTEEGFTRMMNRLAQKIGMEESHFTTSTGLPDPDQYVTASDLAKVAKYIIREHPEFFKLYAQEAFEWEGINQRNRNPLLDSDIGVDGMKTGYTDASGYGIVVTAKQNGTRRILVINGTKSSQERRDEAYKLMDWSFRAFIKVPVVKKGDEIGSVRIYGGDSFSVPIRAADNLDALTERGVDFEDSYRAQLTYEGPLRAPLSRGQKIGMITLYDDQDNIISKGEVEIAQDVGKGPIYRRALDATLYLIGLF